MKKKSNKFVSHLYGVSIIEDDKKNLDQMIKSSAQEKLEGSIIAARVIKIEKDFVTVDANLKNESRIPISEFKSNVDSEFSLKEGETVDVFVERVDSKKGTVLSRLKVLKEETWKKIEQKFSQGEQVSGVIFSRIKGGFTVDIDGVIAFLPGSQVDVRPVKDMDSLLGIKQPFQILKMDKALSNIIVSRKAILEESRLEAKEQMLSKIDKGTVLSGIVKNITDYGAFIDLGSIDGLLHVTDISWNRINHPSEVLTLGEEIKVVVIQYDEKTKRVSLGRKQLDNNPWQEIDKKFSVNQKMTGKITNIADYGIFVKLADGVEGLVHLSEIAWGKNTYNPKKKLKVGQEIEFMIIGIDKEKHRISLSIKKCSENPLIEFESKHPVGSIVTAPIRHITNFGIFVSINENNDAMIHESDISWEKNGLELIKNYKKGQIVESKVLGIDIPNNRVTLGIKQLTEDPAKKRQVEVSKFSKNMVVTCTVTQVKDDGLDVIIEDKDHNRAEGFIKKYELSINKYEQNVKNFVQGDKFDAKILFLKNNGKANLSIKALESEIRERAIKEYGSASSGARLDGIIGAALEEKNTELSSTNTSNNSSSEDKSLEGGKLVSKTSQDNGQDESSEDKLPSPKLKSKNSYDSSTKEDESLEDKMEKLSKS